MIEHDEPDEPQLGAVVKLNMIGPPEITSQLFPEKLIQQLQHCKSQNNNNKNSVNSKYQVSNQYRNQYSNHVAIRTYINTRINGAINTAINT